MNDLFLPINIGLTGEKKIELSATGSGMVNVGFFYLDYKQQWQPENGFILTIDKSKAFLESLSETIKKAEKLTGVEEKPKKRTRAKKQVKEPKTLAELFTEKKI